jgi:serine/threonine protein kinase/TRAP-type mannitol/chloroaromatic compound transport system substrate-binding protein
VEFRQALPVGSILGGDYRIADILGQGGFGLTYKAIDTRLGTLVAIKEYFPSDIAFREQSETVRARSAREEGIFGWGREKFLDEARTLARFRQSNIVRVARFFEANNTAYMVIDFEEGPNLAEWRHDLPHPPHQADLDRIASALLDAVEAVHDAGVLHRDIKPANVIMRDGNEPILIDFGAARQSLGARSKTVHAIVTPGYSPKEQYALDVDRQGPWTDIYALGATLYFLVTEQVPADAPSRDLDDAAEMDMGRLSSYRPRFLNAIQAAMSVRAEDRPQSVAEWRAMLLDGAEPDMLLRSPPGQRSSAVAGQRASLVSPEWRAQTANSAGRGATTGRPRTSRWLLLAALAAILTVTGGIWYYVLVFAPAQDEAHWRRAQQTDTVTAFNDYLAAHPAGRYVEVARARRLTLGGAATGPAQPSSETARPREPVSAPVSPPDPATVSTDLPPELLAPEPSQREDTPTGPSPSASVPPLSGPPSTVIAAPTPVHPDQAIAAQPPGPPPSADAGQPPPVTPTVLNKPLASPARPSLRPHPSPSGLIDERATLPPALTQAEVDRIRRSVTPAEWQMALGLFAGSTPGYSEQSSDFIAELERLSGGKLKTRVLTGNDAPRGNVILHQVNLDSRYIGWHSPSQSVARDRTYALLAGLVPFGLPPAAHVRWMRQEGANLLEQLYRRDHYDVRAIPCGIAGTPGGWVDKDLQTPADVAGLKVSGSVLWLAALQKHGAVPVTIADFRQAFTTNQVDAVFPLTPLTSVFLRQPLLARHYYHPGVQQGSHMLDLLIGSRQWQGMSDGQRSLVDEACRRNLDKWIGKYGQSQTAVLTQIRSRKIKVRPLPSQMQDALRKSAEQVLNEEADHSADFKRVLDSYNRFRS